MREMKDSGVEWIGKIPKDWEIVPLTKQLDSIVDYRGKTPEKTEEGTFLVTAKNIKDGKICYELSKEYVREADYEEIMHRGIPQIGDILFTTEAPLGQVANVDRTDIALAQRIIKFRALRYNVMLSEDENTYANDEWSRLLPDIRHNATVDLDAVFGELQLINPRAKSFLSGIQTAFMASDIDMADELIRKRERSLKGAARAKLSRTKEFDHSKWVGGGMLDYRFSNARRIVNDIYAGEVNADV